jgi:hypothetical protein
MPGDLGLEEGPVTLSESPNSTEETEEQQSNGQYILITDHQGTSSKRPNSIGKLHPYTRLLTISDLESCVALENAAFPIEQERATRDKVSKQFGTSGKLNQSLTVCSAATAVFIFRFLTKKRHSTIESPSSSAEA